MALFFLLFTLADVVFPPPCSDDCATHRSVSTSEANYDNTVNATTLVANDAPCPKRSPDRQCGDEDCCFGCAHMLSINAFTGIVVFDLKSRSAIPSAVFVPAPPLRLTDHPPRLA
jgi:hypothetical protein